MIRCAWCGQDTTRRPRVSFFIPYREQNVTVCQSCATNGEFLDRFPRDHGAVCAPAVSAVRSATCPCCHRKPRTVYTTTSGQMACADCLEKAATTGIAPSVQPTPIRQDATVQNGPKASDKQRSAILNMLHRKGVSDQEIDAISEDTYGCKVADLTVKQASAWISTLQGEARG